MTKVCRTCGVTKDVNEFYAHPGMKDGRFKDCATCFRAYRKTLYRKIGEQDTETVSRPVKVRRPVSLSVENQWNVPRWNLLE